jgi:hypothetical protein
MYLLRTVRLTLVFLVGDFLKSTRHLYIPPSFSRTLSTVSFAGSSVYRKNARPPRTCSSAQCFAWSKDFPRESKLQHDIRFSGYISRVSMWTLGVPFQLYWRNFLSPPPKSQMVHQKRGLYTERDKADILDHI